MRKYVSKKENVVREVKKSKNNNNNAVFKGFIFLSNLLKNISLNKIHMGKQIVVKK